MSTSANQAEKDEAASAMLAALKQIAVNLKHPDHVGDIDPAAAKRGRAVPRPYADNTCACHEHRQLRRAYAAIAQAEAAGIKGE